MSDGRPTSTVVPAQRRARLLGGVGLVALLVVVAAVSFHRAVRARYDFHHFYLDARHVWEHGALNPSLDHPDPHARRQLPFYLPVVPLLLAPLTFGGPATTAALWATGQTLSLLTAIWVLSGWCRDGHDPWRHTVTLCATGVLGLAAIIEAAKFNQLTLPLLALLLGGLAALERGRPVRAGILLGLSVVLKLLPAVLLVWLALKRQWRAAAALTVTVFVVAVAPCLAVFGVERTAAYHRQWWQHNVRGPAARGMATAATPDDPTYEGELADHLTDRRNQALPVVLARLLSPEQPHHVAFQPVRVSVPTAVGIARGALLVLLGVLIWLTRGRWGGLPVTRRRAEFAVYLLAMMVLAPLVRQYYLAWALPALMVLILWARGEPPGRARLGWLGIGVWLAGMLAWTWEPARVCGAHWLMLCTLGGVLLGGVRRDAGAVAVVTPQKKG